MKLVVKSDATQCRGRRCTPSDAHRGRELRRQLLTAINDQKLVLDVIKYMEILYNGVVDVCEC